VLRAVGETETTQESIQDWLELDEGDPGFQLLIEEEIAAVMFYLLIFISTIHIIKFYIHSFSKIFWSFRAIFCFINPDDSQLIRIREGLRWIIRHSSDQRLELAEATVSTAKCGFLLKLHKFSKYVTKRTALIRPTAYLRLNRMKCNMVTA
jgi:hypothetical protein